MERDCKQNQCWLYSSCLHLRGMKKKTINQSVFGDTAKKNFQRHILLQITYCPSWPKLGSNVILEPGNSRWLSSSREANKWTLRWDCLSPCTETWVRRWVLSSMSIPQPCGSLTGCFQTNELSEILYFSTSKGIWWGSKSEGFCTEVFHLTVNSSTRL